jgi:hypothetical protein
MDKSQNYWLYGLCPSSSILKTVKHSILETGSVSFMGPLEWANLIHWTVLVLLTTAIQTPEARLIALLKLAIWAITCVSCTCCLHISPIWIPIISSEFTSWQRAVCNSFMMPSIATKFQYVNSLLFSLSLTTCFGPYGPSSDEIYNEIFLRTIF